MKQLVVPYCENLDFGMCAEARIKEFDWRKNDHMPETVLRLCWDHSGLVMEAVSHETRLRMEADTDGRNVWHDSCMELFSEPAKPEHRYTNLEMNPKGTMVMGSGSSKMGRVRLEEKYKPYLGLSAEIREAEGLWLARYLTFFKFSGEVFGGPPEEARFRKFYVNFYKCGEMTELPHYGIWSKINGPASDFHRPEFFGELRLVE